MLEVHSNLLHPFGAQPISPPFFNINEEKKFPKAWQQK
jgi:hypothetical protein